MNEETLAQFRKECQRLNKRLAWATRYGHKAAPKFMTWSQRYVTEAYDRRETFYTVSDDEGKHTETKFALPLSYAPLGHRFFDAAGVPACHDLDLEAPAPPPEARDHARVVHVPQAVEVVFEAGPEVKGYGIFIFTHVKSGKCLVGKSMNIRGHMRTFRHSYSNGIGANRRMQDLINDSPLVRVDFYPCTAGEAIAKYREVYLTVAKENLLNAGIGKVGKKYRVRYQPVIDEVVFDSLSEASQKLAISVGIIRNRCLSPRYATWRLFDSIEKRYLAKEYSRASLGRGEAA